MLRSIHIAQSYCVFFSVDWLQLHLVSGLRCISSLALSIPLASYIYFLWILGLHRHWTEQGFFSLSRNYLIEGFKLPGNKTFAFEGWSRALCHAYTKNLGRGHLLYLALSPVVPPNASGLRTKPSFRHTAGPPTAEPHKNTKDLAKTDQVVSWQDASNWLGLLRDCRRRQ